MSFKVAPVLDRNVFDRKKLTAFVPANASTKVFDDVTRANDVNQFVTREIYNAGPTAVWYRYGETCIPPTTNDATGANASLGAFNGQIAVGQMLVLETLEDFYVYAVGGVAYL